MAQAVGFSSGTLCEYMASKEDVLYLACQAIPLEMEPLLKERLKFVVPAARAAAIEVYFKVCDEMSDHILLIYQETKSLPKKSMRFVLAHEERITAIFADLLARAVAELHSEASGPRPDRAHGP